MPGKKTGNAMIVLLLAVTGSANAAPGSEPGDDGFRALRDVYLARYKPALLKSEAAWWEANTTGTDEAFARKGAADKALVELHSDRKMLTRLESLKNSGEVSDPSLRRQLDVMYRAFLPAKADPGLRKQIVELENEVEQTFNIHRSKVGDKTLTENDIRKILAETSKSTEAEEAWKAYMAVGAKVDGALHRLVRLRNAMARQVGFDNFYLMQLALQEIDETEFFTLFDELDAITREPFTHVKRDVDKAMGKRFGLTPSELRPWHYGDLFFQEAPRVDEINLDSLFADVDLLALGKKYYAGLSLPCEDILARSDLYERSGKSPHAFCADLDREGDVRILCNLKPNLYWADTLHHELGHAVYDKHIRRDVPFLLHTASHSITTEGIAVMFGAMVKGEDWLNNVLELDPKEAARIVRSAQTALRAEKILFARWTQVMVHFEHGLYSDPDQNLGKLWWDLKKRYQLLSPPETVDRPDYAAKMHVLAAPAYYHSYLMGSLFAAQVQHFIGSKVLGKKDAFGAAFFGEPRVGAYLREKVFGPGNLHSWNELTRLATGEPLTAKYFVKQLAEE